MNFNKTIFTGIFLGIFSFGCSGVEAQNIAPQNPNQQKSQEFTNDQLEYLIKISEGVLDVIAKNKTLVNKTNKKIIDQEKFSEDFNLITDMKEKMKSWKSEDLVDKNKVKFIKNLISSDTKTKKAVDIYIKKQEFIKKKEIVRLEDILARKKEDYFNKQNNPRQVKVLENVMQKACDKIDALQGSSSFCKKK